MKKLEDIPKKTIFEVPEGYFDKLPGVIQSRIAEQNPVKERIPYLASVNSQDLVDYLDEGEVSIDEILDEINADEINPDELNTMDLDFSEADLLELSDEFENDQL
jgi:hypothetical protein